jgi:hypothetical protein
MPAMGIAPKFRLDVAFAGKRLPDALSFGQSPEAGINDLLALV